MLFSAPAVIAFIRMTNPGKTLLILLSIGLTAQVAEARRFGVQPPIPVRITTYVNEKLEGIKPDFEWLVADRKTEYRLYVLNLVVKNCSVLPLGIDAAVAPYRVKFQLAGDKSALAAFAATPPRRQTVLDGYIRFAGGARILMLDKIELVPEATPAPTAAVEPH